MGSIFVLKGLMIYIYAFDHNPPHIHVRGGDDIFTITLKDRVVEGKAKSQSINMINEFIDANMDTIMSKWERPREVKK